VLLTNLSTSQAMKQTTMKSTRSSSRSLRTANSSPKSCCDRARQRWGLIGKSKLEGKPFCSLSKSSIKLAWQLTSSSLRRSCKVWKGRWSKAGNYRIMACPPC
jgi:hypothetical protein